MPHLNSKLDSSKFSLAMIREITLTTLEMNVIVKAVEAVTNDLSLRYDPIKKTCYWNMPVIYLIIKYQNDVR